MKKADRERAALEGQLRYLEGYTQALRVMLTGAVPLLMPGVPSSNGVLPDTVLTGTPAGSRSKRPSLAAAFAEMRVDHSRETINPGQKRRRRMSAQARANISAGLLRRPKAVRRAAAVHAAEVRAHRKRTLTKANLQAMRQNAAIGRAALAEKRKQAAGR